MTTTKQIVLTQEQMDAVKCAYMDLVGALQSYNQYEVTVHDWESHLVSIKDLENVFSFIKPIEVELERQD